MAYHNPFVGVRQAIEFSLSSTPLSRKDCHAESESGVWIRKEVFGSLIPPDRVAGISIDCLDGIGDTFQCVEIQVR